MPTNGTNKHLFAGTLHHVCQAERSCRTSGVVTGDNRLSDQEHQLLLSSEQLGASLGRVIGEPLTKGVRGSYLINKALSLTAGDSQGWLIVADIDKNHNDVCELTELLNKPAELRLNVEQSIADNQNDLIKLMSGADAWQLTNQENTSVHHYANVLFNNMRGGVIENNYDLDKQDVIKTLRNANIKVVEKHSAFFADLPDSFTHAELYLRLRKSIPITTFAPSTCR